MKKLFLLLTLSLFILSCDKAKEEKTQEKKGSKKEFVYSENIQDTFFGVKFGASREEVIKAFEKEGLYFVEGHSTRDDLVFIPSSCQYAREHARFSFGGMDWLTATVSLSNGKFYAILFQHTPEYKETALSRFESVLSALSSKYKMNEDQIENTYTYKSYTATSKDGKGVVVSCIKGKNNDGQIRYRIDLVYADVTLDKPNNEL